MKVRIHTQVIHEGKKYNKGDVVDSTSPLLHRYAERIIEEPIDNAKQKNKQQHSKITEDKE